MDETNIQEPCRGRLSGPFRKKIESDSADGLKSLIDYVRSDKNLDIQFRDNYINIYYDGGCALRVGPKSLNLDPYYFYLERDNNDNEIPKTYIEEQRKNTSTKNSKKNLPCSYPSPGHAISIYNDLYERCQKVLKHAQEHNFETYFNEVKNVVGRWVEHYNRIERREQHYIACSNRDFTPKNDLVVIDIEFAVSKKKSYNNLGNKVPKFDIIAVDKDGQLYVIELKANLAADKDNSAQSVNGHQKDFDSTIGNHCNDNDFVAEMRKVLKLKKDINLIDSTAQIGDYDPIFAVAFSGEEKWKREFTEKHKGIKFVDVVMENNNKRYLKIR